jgi:plastocyanin domain-containing protein
MKSAHYIIGIVIILVLIGFFVFSSGSSSSNSNSGTGSGTTQEVTLSYKNYNYYPQTITVKANQPVKIYLDSSVKGCFRQFVIKDFGINKHLKSPSDYIEFTPTKTGTFVFQCGMGMGTGKLIVE